ARFTIEPYDNMWYEPFYRQTIIKDVPFAMPLAGTLTGPLWGMSGTDYTWQTNITSGSGDFTYTWYKQSAGSNVWDPITSSNGSTCSLLMGSTNFTLKCDVTDTFNGQTKSFSKYITSGTLLSSEQWFGNNNITGPVTVPAGITLTIVNHPGDPATKLTFTNGASLNVNGSFVVNGESTKKITFDFVAPNSTLQNGIRVNQGGGVVLSHSIIKNGYIGININQALGSIANSEITGCSFGFVISGTNYIVTQPEITNCKIHANPSAGSGWGFLVSGSSPLLIGNEIYDNFTGVFLSGLSQPSFGNQWNYGNNNIHNNTGYGIYESYYSPPFLGRDGCEVNGGRNILENNGIRDLYVTSYVPVIAENNWWGSNSPSTTKIYSAYNTIDYYPWLGFRPTQQYANMKLFPEENLFNSKFDNGLLKSIDNNLRETAEIPDENVSLKEKNLNNKYVNTEINSLNIKPITAILDSNLSLIYKLGYAKRQIDLKHYQTAQLIAKEIIEKY
ncbi:MAG: right-handed parallel beta-helix repeat-containing protein, partial [Ignavibacteria bacterium]|nr:right-handed parallel beta-helix repeat-containing protein [Ignavibacteria bacterium]